MWPGFDSRSRRHMWVEFVVGSRSCYEGFSPGAPVFLPPQKPTFSNSNSTWKQWSESHSVDSTEIPIYYNYYYYYLFIYLCCLAASAVKKCTKIYNARAGPLFFLLNPIVL